MNSNNEQAKAVRVPFGLLERALVSHLGFDEGRRTTDAIKEKSIDKSYFVMYIQNEKILVQREGEL